VGTTELKFNDIYNEYHDKLLRYLQRMVGPNDAEDVTQEVFVKIDKGLNEFKGQSSLSTWVYRIATNAALDRIKSRAHRQEAASAILEDADNETEGLCAEEPSLSAEREAIRNEMTECIREFVDKLPESYRTVIILSELKDLANQEIAEILGISLVAVKIRLHRARVKLKEAFETGCHFYYNENNELSCDRKKQAPDSDICT